MLSQQGMKSVPSAGGQLKINSSFGPADKLGMNSERVWRIITDLEMRKICAKMVPRLLNEGKRSGLCWCVKTFWRNSKLNPTCWKELLLAMSHGFSITIHSPNGRALNGRAHCHQDPKRRGCLSPKPGWCWSLFWCPWNYPRRILAKKPNY